MSMIIVLSVVYYCYLLLSIVVVYCFLLLSFLIVYHLAENSSCNTLAMMSTASSSIGSV